MTTGPAARTQPRSGAAASGMDGAARARRTAALLLEIEAVRLAPPESAFRLTSGRASPVYVDCRRILSFPAVRDELIEHAVRAIGARGGDFSLIAGGETAGIPFAALIADRLGMPMVYVRKRAKGFGRDRLIEGSFARGARVLLVEDMMTDGASKVGFVRTLRDAGLSCSSLFVFFRYGVFGAPEPALRDLEVEAIALATWRDVLKRLEERRAPDGTGAALANLRRFLDDPHGWRPDAS